MARIQRHCVNDSPPVAWPALCRPARPAALFAPSRVAALFAWAAVRSQGAL